MLFVSGTWIAYVWIGCHIENSLDVYNQRILRNYNYGDICGGEKLQLFNKKSAVCCRCESGSAGTPVWLGFLR